YSAAYGNFGHGAYGYGTHAWSNNYMVNRAGYVRGGFNNWGAFGAGWWGRYPGAWAFPGWGANYAWNAAAWSTLASWCSIPAAPVYYDYGNTVCYQGNDVYVNGDNVGTAADYNTQAINLAAAGAQAQPPQSTQWQPLGVFALAQGTETNSNNLFQL